MISQEIIDRVRAANDIVEIISNYISLKSTGKNYKGLCPFHQEKTPSFVVNPERQIFHCFGCGVGGNVYHFLMRIDSLTFTEVVQELAKKANITLNYSGNSDSSVRNKTDRLGKIVAWATAYFTQKLKITALGQRAREYLKQRDIPNKLWKEFSLGYAPLGWDELIRAAKHKKISLSELEQAGLIISKADKHKNYDRFRNRLIFPIFDLQNNPVGFGGRILEAGEPKYLNSPESEVFHKGELLYGLNLARQVIQKSNRLILVEGYMDVLACHKAGFTETVANLGTALTRRQAQLIRRYTNKVILSYDSDQAGIKATQRAYEILNEMDIKVNILDLGQYKDPDEYIKIRGKAGFEQALARAQSGIDFFLQRALQSCDIKTIAGKIEVVNQLATWINQIKNQIEQHEYIQKLAESLNLKSQVVLNEIRRQGKSDNNYYKQTSLIKAKPTSYREEELIIAILMRYPAWLNKMKPEINEEFFEGLKTRALAEKLLSAEFNAQEHVWETWLPNFLNTLEMDLSALATKLVEEKTPDIEPGKILADCLKFLKINKLRGQLENIQLEIKNTQQQGDIEMFKHLAYQKKILAEKLNQLKAE